MNNLINSITERKFDEAGEILKEHLSQIVERKMVEMKKMTAAKVYASDLNEAIVHDDGRVHTATGEHILPSVWRARRGLTEEQETSEDKEAKIQAALLKAKMMIQPELDTNAPPIDRGKVRVMPSGHRGRRDMPNIISDKGPREAEWEAGKLAEGRMKDIVTAAAEKKRLEKRHTILVMPKKKPGEKEGDRQVMRIDRLEYDPEKHDLAAE